MNFNEIVKLISWIVILEMIGYFFGRLTLSNLYWYEELNKSSLTPPGIVFSIVWSILYALIAIVGWDFWRNRNNTKMRSLIYLYFIQLVMNWVWTPIFFQLRWLGISFIWIIIMIFLNGVIVINIKNEKKQIALILTIYCIWLIFAAYLNGVIWAFN